MTARLKYMAEIIAGQSPAGDDVGDEGDLPFIQGCSEFGAIHPSPIKFCDRATKIAQPSDILLSVRAPVGEVNVANASLGIGRGVAAIRAAPHVSHRYCYWLLSASAQVLQSVSSGSTFEAISATDIANLSFPDVDTRDQERIANFLDEQTARIDALIAEKERLKSVLAAMKSDAIDTAVLGDGTANSGQPLKGLEVLGAIPAGWISSRMKFELEYVTSGSRGWAEYYADNGALFVRIGNLTRDSIELDRSDVQRVALPDSAEGVRARVHKGDLLISITAYLGSVAVAPADIEEAYVSQHVSLARPNCRRALPKWLGYVVLSSVGRTFFDLQAYGGTKVQLSLDDIRELPVPLPQPEVQRERIDLLEARLRSLDELAIHAQEHIARLREYRSSLISSAVTGQLKF